MNRVAVLVSSGVESVSLLYLYLCRGFLVYPFYVRSKLPWEKSELIWLEKIWHHYRRRYRRILPFRTVPLGSPVKNSGIGGEEDIEIPLRNFSLVSAMALHAFKRKIGRIAIGSLGAYPFPDNNRSYFDSLQELVSTGLKTNMLIETPFMGKEKWDVIREFYGKVPFELTFSCVNPVGALHCGECAKCKERKEGFAKAGVPDPTHYLS